MVPHTSAPLEMTQFDALLDKYHLNLETPLERPNLLQTALSGGFIFHFRMSSQSVFYLFSCNVFPLIFFSICYWRTVHIKSLHIWHHMDIIDITFHPATAYPAIKDRPAAHTRTTSPLRSSLTLSLTAATRSVRLSGNRPRSVPRISLLGLRPRRQSR